MLWHNMLPFKPGTSGQTPSLYDKLTGFFYVHYTTQYTGSTAKDAATMVKCLAKGYRCHDWVLNPHSGDQKHQSLSQVFLSARP